MSTEKTIEAVKEELVSKLNPDFVVLFFSKDDNYRQNDIDIFVVAENLPQGAAERMQMEFMFVQKYLMNGVKIGITFQTPGEFEIDVFELHPRLIHISKSHKVLHDPRKKFSEGLSRLKASLRE